MSFTYDYVTSIIKTSLPKVVVEDMMELVQNSYGKCTDSNYDEDTSNKLKAYMTAYMIDKMQGNGRVTSKTAPNGSSISMSEEDGSNFSGNPYGYIISSFDTSGCWHALVESKSGFIYSYNFGGTCSGGSCR